MKDKNGNEEYGFCPDCGALMKDGVCMNCGRGKEKGDTDAYGRTAGQEGPDAWGADRPDGQNISDQPGGGNVRNAYGPDRPGGQDIWDQMHPSGVQNDRDPDQPGGQGSWGPGQPGGQGGWGPGQPGGQGSWGPGQPGGRNGWDPGQPGGQGGWGPGQPGGRGFQDPGQGGGYRGWNNGQYGDYGSWNGPQSGYGPYRPYGTPPVQQEKRNDHRTVAAVVAAVIAVLLCVVMVLLFVIVKDSVRVSGGLTGNKDYFFSDPPEERDPDEGEDWKDDLLAPWQEDEEEYVPSAEDEYYVKLTDSIRDDLDYTVVWEEYDNVDEDTGATAVGRYPQIEGGNIPHLDDLNAFVKEEATYYSNLYGYYREWGDATLYASESMGYVTYMDEEKISIVLQESIATEDGSNISLYSINIDLMSGEIMDNGRIIEYSEELTQAFREQNDHQNGYVRAVDVMTDEKLQDFLSDENTNIVFYTPVGLEIGFNYTTSDSSGWVTATIRDYERYRKKF